MRCPQKAIGVVGCHIRERRHCCLGPQVELSDARPPPAVAAAILHEVTEPPGSAVTARVMSASVSVLVSVALASSDGDLIWYLCLATCLAPPRMPFFEIESRMSKNSRSCS